MRYAIINNGLVVNVAESDSQLDDNWVPDARGAAKIGSSWDGSNFHDPGVVLVTVTEYTQAVQAHLDMTAQTHNYDGILSACTYAGSSVPKFAAEGQACVLWRDNVWASSYQILGEVQVGQRQPPTISELLTMLPAMTWPEVTK